MRYFLIIILLIQIGCSSSAQKLTAENRQNITEVKQSKAERRPFQKSSVTIKSPKDYLHRESENGKEFDPKPRFVEINKKEGKYELRWIGYDGKEKVIAYQRADAIDAVVEAGVEKTFDNKFVYKYLIKNLPTSPTYLSGFIVQTLTMDMKVNKINDVHIGKMSNSIQNFKEGVWWHFAPLGENSPSINPGKSIEFSLNSSGLPGIVGCRATAGEMTLKGVGEHMPSELENMMPGYEELAKGYTIGPIDSLKILNESERAKYISDNLPKFLEAGWITDIGMEKYQLILKKQDLHMLFLEAKKDFEKEYITSELFHIIEGLDQ